MKSDEKKALIAYYSRRGNNYVNGLIKKDELNDKNYNQKKYHGSHA